MRHTLFVFPLINLKRMFAHRERFAYTEHAAVPEYGEYAFDELLLFTVEGYVLIIQKSHYRFAYRKSYGLIHNHS